MYCALRFVLIIAAITRFTNSLYVDNAIGKSCYPETINNINTCGTNLICYNGTCSNCNLDPDECISLNGECIKINNIDNIELNITNPNITDICYEINNNNDNNDDDTNGDVNNAIGKSCNSDNKRRICGEKLICYNNTCSNCNLNPDDCSTTSNIICKEINNTSITHDIYNPNVTHICEHKNIFDGVNGWDIFGMIINFLVGMFASVSGIGGGGIYVVMLLTINEFPIEMAARISKSMIFGIGVANIFNFLPIKHINQNKPLIDYDISIMLEPYTIGGTIFGIIINVIFPRWLITLLFIILLTIITIKILLKYNKLRKKDNNRDNNSDNNNDNNNNDGDLEMNNSADNTNTINNIDNDDNIGKYYVLPKNAVLFLCIALLIIFTVFKGNKNTESILGIEQCSGLYWGLNIIELCVLSLIGFLSCIYVYNNYQRKVKNGYRPTNGDGNIKWNIKKSFMLPPCLILGGISAAAFGLGGGLIQAPIMLELNMLPEVVIATSAYLLIFTAFSTIVQYFIFELIPIDYAIVYIIVGFTSSTMGHMVIGYFINKYGRPNILILILGILSAIITLIGLSYGIFQVVTDLNDGVSMGFKSLC